MRLLGHADRMQCVESAYTRPHQLFAEVVPEVADEVHEAIPRIRLWCASQASQTSSRTHDICRNNVRGFDLLKVHKSKQQPAI